MNIRYFFYEQFKNIENEGDNIGSWFECKWNAEKCDKCSGCRNCGNCSNLDHEYYENDGYDCCNWCYDNPYHDDRNK